jgi:hypothetical protein
MKRRLAMGSAVLLALLASAPGARADDREACATAAEQAQQLRDEGAFRKARDRMITCSRDVCPAPIKRDCLQWLGELDKSAPSVVVGARVNDRDVTDVKVTLDGELVAERLDGKPIAVDPGEHTFTFEHAGQTVEEKVLIRTGEKNRPLNVKLKGGAEPPPPPGGTTAPPPVTDDGGGSLVPALVAGGIGVVALGSFAFFGLSGKSAVDDLQSCKPRCAESDVDSARTKLIVADISLAVGVVALGVATYLFITRPKASAKVETTGLRVDVAPTRGGGLASFGLTF